ncbi:MAG: LysM peptidoglycan-binding domain-containing protein [Thermoleophilia bacterium]|nr:LysM peptidoglycan-binding domain-containing protein [Thermoleophilia bacterium]
MEPHSATDERRTPGPRRRRRFSIWTVLAPAGAIVLFVLLISSVQNSCIARGTCTKSKDSNGASGKPANDVKAGAKAKVVQGQSMGSIAAKYNLSVAELQACNPLIDAQTLQPGQRLNVSAIDCEGQDLAKAGANPDPLADDTAAVDAKGAKTTPTPDPTKNGTAAADPTAGQ